jgi:hypothetical protein
MSSPFPGMDVYLEAQGHWESFHTMLIASCAEALNRDLPASYMARVETRIAESCVRWIEIVKLPEQSLITVIEILSPSNKAGSGRSDYLAKRNELIDQETVNLVEIDLLLGGSRMPMSRRLPPGDYYATVARAERRPDAEVYAWPIRRPLPAVPIPLHAPDGDVSLQLAEVVSMAYDRGGFARSMRYGELLPPTFPINPADRAWVEERSQSPRQSSV